MKTNDDYFNDWESHVFGFGYGSGEEHVLWALKTFFDSLGRADASSPCGYDYRELERALGPAVAWLLINALGHADLIEYGSSPRYAWLTQYGEALRDYCAPKTAEELTEIATRSYDRHCYPDHCNCEGEECSNPFWRHVGARGRNKPFSEGD